jgi:two-component system, chemotaxis family, chemotaxis protein CheY
MRMRVLIVDDDFISRRLLHKILSVHGDCDIAVDGAEAIKAFELAWSEGKPYDLICMDIVMPNIDGQQALKTIRESERERSIHFAHEVKVIMTTSVADPESVENAIYKGGATSYLIKPVSRSTMVNELEKLGLIEKNPPEE